MLMLVCTLAAALLLSPGEPALYGISTGSSGKLGELVTLDSRDGTTKSLGAFTNHPGFSVPRDIVRSSDGKAYYLAQLEIGEGWAKTHLQTVEAKSLKVEQSVLLGEAFDALVVDANGRLLAGRFDKDGSALVRLDPKTGKDTLIGRPGRDFQFASFELEPRSGKLLGLAALMHTSRFVLVWVDPATGKADSSVQLDLAETPLSMALCKDGKARLVTDKQKLYEADPSSGRTHLLGRSVAGNVVGLHAGN